MRLASKRTDEITTLEQGSRVERQLYLENSDSALWAYNGVRSGHALAELFVIRGRVAKKYREWSERQQEVEAATLRRLNTPLHVTTHGFPCEDPYCQPCDDGVKRLLADLLPKGGKR